jgi:hypothetical protein
MHINNQPQVKNIEITNAVTYSNGNATPTNTNGGNIIELLLKVCMVE